ncbi:MAG: hypothetical protein Q7S47_02280 [bacterium]|nr:hypothetical protein [bacterium]
MANVMDFCELLAQEGRAAQLLQQFQNEASSKEGKKKIQNLRKLSVQKMRVLHEIIKDAPWNFEYTKDS